MDKACKKSFELLGDFNCTSIDYEGVVKLWKGYFFVARRCLICNMLECDTICFGPDLSQ